MRPNLRISAQNTLRFTLLRRVIPFAPRSTLVALSYTLGLAKVPGPAGPRLCLFVSNLMKQTPELRKTEILCRLLLVVLQNG